MSTNNPNLEGNKMAMEVKVTPKALFGYALLIIGLILLGYVGMNCILLASGTIEPLSVEIIGLNVDTAAFVGIILQLGAYALLIAISYALMKMGMSIKKT